jgi:hypothetical protein
MNDREVYQINYYKIINVRLQYIQQYMQYHFTGLLTFLEPLFSLTLDWSVARRSSALTVGERLNEEIIIRRGVKENSRLDCWIAVSPGGG